MSLYKPFLVENEFGIHQGLMNIEIIFILYNFLFDELFEDNELVLLTKH